MRLFFSMIGLMLISLLFACQPDTRQQPLSDAVVLALGDSLTAGYGAGQGESYPELLAEQTPWQVINAGISGDTSAQALARLPDLLVKHQPQLVIISIGGNDFLQRQNEQQTRDNIQAMIALAQSNQAQVLLVGIPYYSVRAALGMPKDHPLYQEIADKEKITLLSGAWGDVLKDSNLRSDQIHPNTLGYQQFTLRLLAFLKDEGWLQ